VPILSTQQLGDIADQDNLIGHWFLFGMRSREHATRGLELLDLDTDDDRLLESLTERFGRGWALYRDLYHRCEEIQFDPDPRLLELLKTTPEAEQTFALDTDPEAQAGELAA
jgi:AAA-like domain